MQGIETRWAQRRCLVSGPLWSCNSYMKIKDIKAFVEEKRVIRVACTSNNIIDHFKTNVALNNLISVN